MTTDHLKTRKQFGQPLGNFQALQHRLVELWVLIEICRSSLMRAETAANDADAGHAAAMISAVKSRCSDAALKLARECIQLHGAIGYTEEYDLSLLVNRMLVLAGRLGNARAHREHWFSDQFSAAGDF